MARQNRTVTTLLEAMPYIQRFAGATIVIKYGGAAMTSQRLQEEFARDVVLLQLVGMRPIVVRGGGPQVSQMMKRLGMDPKFVRGHRVTDEETMEVARMVLVGKVNKDMVGLIHRHGGTAVGLSGEDGQLLITEPLAHHDDDGRPVDIGLVGQIREVNVEVLQLLAAGAIPIVASIGADEAGQAYNINADTAAGAIAKALSAKRFLLLSDIPGVLDKDGNLIREMSVADARKLIEDGTATGGMIPKLETCIAALDNGVEAAVILDGRQNHVLLMELFTEHGAGTLIH
jgi:acetylglutamate kinase